MDPWTEIDAYCERLGPGLWAEPLNAVTNLAFLVAAWISWRQATDAIGRRLAVALGVVGVASLAFHTLAVAWAGAADSLAILVFAVLYIDAAVRAFLGWRGVRRALGVGACLTVIVGGVPVLSAAAPWLGPNAFYLAIALLILGWGIARWRGAPLLGRGLVLCASILLVSITARMLDEPSCQALPIGTHWLWHLLNAAVLGGLIAVRRRHLEAAGAGR